jgi:plastocyanin
MTRESNNKKGIPVSLFLAGMLSMTFTLFGQTSHTVTVSNYTFSPKEITISAGDTVIWKNNQGTHNVNGTMETYPSNPESFGNSLGSGWTYSHVFNITGNYDYRCDPHYASGMTGKIFVEGTATGNNSDIPETITENQILIYPNPATDYLTIDLQSGNEKFQSIRILNLVGKELLSVNNPSGKSYQQINVSQFNPGLYLIQIDIDNGTKLFKFIKR